MIGTISILMTWTGSVSSAMCDESLPKPSHLVIYSLSNINVGVVRDGGHSGVQVNDIRRRSSHSSMGDDSLYWNKYLEGSIEVS
jgi:hypothetical protein